MQWVPLEVFYTQLKLKLRQDLKISVLIRTLRYSAVTAQPIDILNNKHYCNLKGQIKIGCTSRSSSTVLKIHVVLSEKAVAMVAAALILFTDSALVIKWTFVLQKYLMLDYCLILVEVNLKIKDNFVLKYHGYSQKYQIK